MLITAVSNYQRCPERMTPFSFRVGQERKGRHPKDDGLSFFGEREKSSGELIADHLPFTRASDERDAAPCRVALPPAGSKGRFFGVPRS